MLNSLDLSADAPWKRRFRAPSVAWSRRAAQNASRGLVCSNQDDVYQLYAWDCDSDELRRLTDNPAGVGAGAISADGERVYYHRDQRGDEIGHYARIPFAGGEPEDITPELPEYASHHLEECASGGALGFVAADENGFHFHVYEPQNTKTALFSRTIKALSLGPHLSQDAEIAVIASTEKTGVYAFALEAWDLRSGELIAELWDGEGSGIDVGGFSPLAGDMRFAGSSNAGGYYRPLIWNPTTGERVDIESSQFRGDVTVWHWSPDGERLLLHQVDQAVHSLYTCDIARDDVRRLNLPPGVPSRGSGFTRDGTIQIHFNDSSAPTRLLELDGESGRVLRSVIDLGVAPPASATWRSVNYSSSDAAPIQAWLATPPGEGPFPDNRAYAWRTDGGADESLDAGVASLARSRIRLFQPELSRLDHLRLRLPTRH